MGKIRNIKPDFFRSRSLARCSIPARLTFIGLWCEADDAGRGIADVDILKGALWPKDNDITCEDISSHLDELAKEHLVLYLAEGDQYYAILNWEDHQAAAYRRSASKYPAPPNVSVASDEPSSESPTGGASDGSAHNCVRDASNCVRRAGKCVLKGKGREGKGREAEVEGSDASRGKQRGSTAPIDMPITEAMRSWAQGAGIRCNIPRETQKFLDHFRANGQVKKDWLAAWRNWMRRADEFAAARGGPSAQPSSGPVTRSRKSYAIGDVRAYRLAGDDESADALQARVDAGEFD